MAGQVGKEELFGRAITIDGRKEWYCLFCSDTNVWTRSRCARLGFRQVLHAEHMQAVSSKSGRSWSASSSSGDGLHQMLAYQATWAKKIA